MLKIDLQTGLFEVGLGGGDGIAKAEFGREGGGGQERSQANKGDFGEHDAGVCGVDGAPVAGVQQARVAGG